MADNPSIDPGTTPSIPVEGDDIGGGVIRQAVVVAWGAKDASVRATAAAPLPVTDAAAEAALGTTSDAAATTTGSVIAQLRRIANTLAGGIGVTGTFWQTTQPVSGTVTADTELPAAAALADAGSSTPSVPMVAAALLGHDSNAATLNRLKTVWSGMNQALTGILAAAHVAQFDDVSPVSVTENNVGIARMSNNRVPYQTIRDAAGNERGVNVTAASTAAAAADPALVVALSPNSKLPFPTVVMAAGAQVSATTAATTLLAAGTYQVVMIRNLAASASSVFIGPSALTATTGMEIKPGELLMFGPGECPSNLIQVITATGTATVIVQTSA